MERGRIRGGGVQELRNGNKTCTELQIEPGGSVERSIDEGGKEKKKTRETPWKVQGEDADRIEEEGTERTLVIGKGRGGGEQT